MRKGHWLLIPLLATVPLAADAETYKCRAPDGKISYTGQISLTPGVKCEPLFARKAPVAPVEAPVAETQAPPAAPAEKTKADKALESKRKKMETDEAKKKAEQTAAAKQEDQQLKEQNCQNAKANLATYQRGGRIGKVNEKGERILLGDDEIKQKLDEAQQDVDKWCGK